MDTCDFTVSFCGWDIQRESDDYTGKSEDNYDFLLPHQNIKQGNCHWKLFVTIVEIKSFLLPLVSASLLYVQSNFHNEKGYLRKWGGRGGGC